MLVNRLVHYDSAEAEEHLMKALIKLNPAQQSASRFSLASGAFLRPSDDFHSGFHHSIELGPPNCSLINEKRTDLKSRLRPQALPSTFPHHIVHIRNSFL
jgi:hypothetical protein